MGRIVEYSHYGVLVAVDEDLKGKHREHCLCYRCNLFHPNQETNCPIAQSLYEICVKENVVTPVYECRVFIEGEPDF